MGRPKLPSTKVLQNMIAQRIVPCGVALIVAALAVAGAPAQSFRKGGLEFNALRGVTVPPGKAYSIVVTEFFHHGQITPEGRNLIVLTRGGQFVPCRVLQLGPGDFCRVGFQTMSGQNGYEILYGGQNVPDGTIPEWTARDGVLLEAREYKSCDLMSLEKVRQAFEKAKPIGADYVEGIFHSSNPLMLAQGPFMSRYSGTMHISAAGNYGFLTGSQDASFFLLDDKLVVSAPGRHPAARQARPENRQTIRLTPGVHPFEYYHVATGRETCASLAWEPNPTDPKPKPERIPSEVYRTAVVAHLPFESLLVKATKFAPDFLVKIEGEVPLPDNEVPVIGVQFFDISAKALTAKGKFRWDFGDGQTSEMADPVHVYLHPGLYTVKLSVTRQEKSLETTNRVYIDKPIETQPDKFAHVEDYLPFVRKYDPHTLDTLGLRQLWDLYDAKAASLDAVTPEQPATAPVEQPKPKRRGRFREVEGSAMGETFKGATTSMMSGIRAKAAEYYAVGVDICQAALLEPAAAQGDEDLYSLAQAVGTAARDRLGQSERAFAIWKGAMRKIRRSDYQADCAATAADIAINDLLRPDEAKPLLDAANAALGDQKGPIGSNLLRVWGDYYAATGDGKAARKCYEGADAATTSSRSLRERIAWLGAHDRSTEDFIVDAEYDRAVAQVHAWEREFPTEKITGQVTYMYARYWAARHLYKQAVAQAQQLRTVSPDSPFIDQTLFIAAACELKSGSPDGALAILYSIKNDYPGSPLVPQVKEQIQKLESTGAKPRGKPGGKSRS
jgi:PKD repeat protein